MVQMLVSVWNVGFSLKWQFQFQTLVSVSKVGAGLGSLRRWRSLGVARPHFAGGFVVGFAQAKKTPGSRQRGGGQRSTEGGGAALHQRDSRRIGMSPLTTF